MGRPTVNIGLHILRTAVAFRPNFIEIMASTEDTCVCHGPIPTSPSTLLQDHKARYLQTMPNPENKNEQTAEGV
ncbi:hypothetical protein CGMCC3_g9741 [Colletotrichum fructicola]|nr:uncharacterized protein CGMCC3_g9741 [Colletotrichum fructicola]KAE9574066.1 hypothetical protein CGMCC3_g9741 [Colletotrichum fructicola]